MKKSKLPKTDSIKKLAEFWDNHDLTDFQTELEVVADPVFVRKPVINAPLDVADAEAVEQLARHKRVSREELIRTWVLQKVSRGKNARSTGS
ncbi:MAG TPA: CopG family antitoxin [Gemmataceae bacterium]|nr:CopG family antitoxin [Gemmataceae bacterium]